MNISSFFSDFLALFYPRYCDICGGTQVKGEMYLCSHCMSELIQTNFHNEKDNPVEMTFAGKVPIFRATAFYYFKKGNPLQKIIHQLKYKGNTEIGMFLGSIFGLTLSENADFSSIDVIIPIPLHPHKLRKRGYNQSEYIALGIGKTMSKPVNTSSLIRTVDTTSQTLKSRYDRWENVSTIFQLKSSDALFGKHILLVDDIITTGSTLEAAAQILLEIPDVKVSVACLGCATH